MASGALTVIGGVNNHALTGLVTLTGGFDAGTTTTLQTLLSAASAAATIGGNFQNINVAGDSGFITPAGGIGPLGTLVISNTDSVGATTGGAATIALTVPSAYSALVVQAPGTELITGNGADSTLAIFDGASTVSYVASTGSGSVYAAGADNVLVDGSSYSVVGGTIGGNAFNVLSNLGAVTTEGGSNVILIAGLADTVVSNSSDDFIGAAAKQGSITVSGFANVIGTNGSTTVTAVGTGTVNAFIDAGYAGKLDFINQSTSASTITGLAGSVTVFGGVGGGHYEGGGLGNNSLTGGTGAVTLVGSNAGGDTLSAASSIGGGNYLIAGGTDSLGNVTTGGNQTLIATSTAGSTTFVLGTGVDLVTTSGSGEQFIKLNSTGFATIVGSAAATTNQFVLSSSDGGNSDVIKNFRIGTDHFSLYSSPGVSISGIANNQTLSAGVTGAVVSLNNGTTIKLVGASFTNTQITSVTGAGGTHTSF